MKITFVLVYVGLDCAMKCGTVRDGRNRRMCPGCAWGMERGTRDGKGFFMSSPHGKAGVVSPWGRFVCMTSLVPAAFQSVDSVLRGS